MCADTTAEELRLSGFQAHPVPQWIVQEPGMAHGRLWHSAVALDPHRILVVGGNDADRNDLGSTEVFDMTSMEWHQDWPDLNQPRSYHATVLCRDKVYVLGGHDGTQALDSIEYLDLSSTSPQWTVLQNARLSHPRAGCAAVVLGDMIYIMGGWDGGTTPQSCMDVFDVTTGTVREGSSMIMPRRGCSASVIHDTIYVVGGDDVEGNKLDTMESFSTEQGEWQMCPPMSTGRSCAATTVVSHCLIVMGGDSDDAYLTSTEVFDINRGVWWTLPEMNEARYGAAAVTLGESRVIITGGSRGVSAHASMEWLNLEFALETCPSQEQEQSVEDVRSRGVCASQSLETVSESASNAQTNLRDLLTVFQAAPLDQLDLEYSSERQALEETLRDAVGDRIEVDFDIATSDRLGNFLSKAEGRILHFSCHGTQKFIALENGWAHTQELEYDQLKKWIQLGGRSLQFVFLAACTSREAGDALIDAGVGHVVCCRTKTLDVATIEFERVFYRNLAYGKTLQESFNLAQHELMQSPLLAGYDRAAEVKKFALLPEDGDRHKVPIFFTSPYSRRCTPNTPSLTVFIPPPPSVFVGRQKAMDDVITSLQSSQLVRVTGVPGIGKNALVRACCHYISYESRARIMNFEEVLWLPLEDEEQDNELHESVSQLFRYFQNKHAKDPPIKNIIRHFREKKSLLVFDTAKHDFSTGGLRKLSHFLAMFLQKVRYCKVIVIDYNDHVLPTGEIVGAKADIEVPALDFQATVDLFALECPHVKACIYPQIRSPYEFVKHVCNEEADDRLKKGVLRSLGEGIPKKICSIATQMTKQQYRELILLSGFTWDESRVQLEKRAEELTEQKALAMKKKDYNTVCTLQEELGVLHLLREDYLSEDQLKAEAKGLEQELEAASRLGDRLKLNQLKAELDRVQALIQKEKDALIALGVKGSGAPGDRNHLPVYGGGRIVATERLKRSGQAVVYRGKMSNKNALDREVAIKVYESSDHWDSCKQEVMYLLRISAEGHPNVMDIVDFYEVPQPCFVMRFVTGGDLRDFLNQHGRFVGDDAVRLLSGIGEGLRHLHAHRFVHRDLKPQNILLEGTCSSMRPVLIDFGLGKRMEAELDELQVTSAEKGTILWMAPEMLMDRQWSTKTDMYALGIVMWEVLTGKMPYSDKSTWHELAIWNFVLKGGRPDTAELENARVSRAHQDIIVRLWDSDPLIRPSAEDFVALLSS